MIHEGGIKKNLSGNSSQGDLGIPRGINRINSSNSDYPLFSTNNEREELYPYNEIEANRNRHPIITSGNTRFLSLRSEGEGDQVPTENKNLNDLYNKESLSYSKYHFDDRTRLIIRRIAIKAYNIYKELNQHQFLSYSLQKMLSLVAKKFFLNRFQLLFLQYVLEQTKWKFQMDTIMKRMNQFHSFINASQQQAENLTLKQLQIYLLYCGYYSKKSLNSLDQQNIFNEFLRSVCLRFQEYFKQWSQSSSVTSMRINPKNLNNIFKRLTYYSNIDKEHLENYSLMVEEIIDISPAYNADKSQKTGKGRKNKKVKPNQNIQQHNVKVQQQSNVVDEQPHYSQMEYPEIPHLNNSRRQASYMSNVDGFDTIAIARNLS